MFKNVEKKLNFKIYNMVKMGKKSIYYILILVTNSV